MYDLLVLLLLLFLLSWRHDPKPQLLVSDLRFFRVLRRGVLKGS